MTDERDAAIREALGPLLADARAGLELEIRAVRATPDLQDVVERAHEVDPVAVPSSFVESSRRVDLLPDEGAVAGSPESPGLQAFLDDAAREVESWAEARSLAPIPPPRRRARRWPWIASGLVAAAALIVLSFRLHGYTLARSEARTASEAAEMSRPADGSGVLPTHPRARKRARVEPRPPEDEVVIVEDDAEPDGATTGNEEGPQRPSLRELEERAKARWAAGDLRGAEKLLEEIVSRGGTSRRAELAFGDLFTIALRIHKTSRQRQLWRRYLKRFPRGRYADDARAGLCRSAAASKRGACWKAYLQDWPTGSYRAEARRGAGDPGDP